MLSPSVVNPWVITTQVWKQNEDVFNCLKPVSGKLSGDIAKKYLMQSLLPTPVLAQIWALSDLDHDGRLTLQEFNIAVHLVQAKLKGLDVPKSLPPSLLQPVEVAQSGTAVGAPALAGFQGSAETAVTMLPSGTGLGTSQYPIPSPGLSTGGTASGPSLGNFPQKGGLANIYSGSMTRQSTLSATSNNPPSSTSMQSESYLARLKSELGSLSEPISMTSPAVRSIGCISSLDRAKYMQLFRSLDNLSSGYLTGIQVRPMFLQSGVDTTQLAAIWDMSDVGKDDRLDVEEFVIAMHLVDCAKSGISIPSVLPASLCASLFSGPGPQAVTTQTFFTPPQATSFSEAPPQVEYQNTTNLSLEDKRRENFLRGQAELERRRREQEEARKREAQEMEEKARLEEEQRTRAKEEAERKRLEKLEEENRLRLEKEKEMFEKRRNMIEMQLAAQMELEIQRQQELVSRQLEERQNAKGELQREVQALQEHLSAVSRELTELSRLNLDLSTSAESEKTACYDLGSSIKDLTNKKSASIMSSQELQRTVLALKEDRARMGKEYSLLTAALNKTEGSPVAGALKSVMISASEKRAHVANLQDKMASLNASIDAENSLLKSTQKSLLDTSAQLKQLKEAYDAKELNRDRAGQTQPVALNAVPNEGPAGWACFPSLSSSNPAVTSSPCGSISATLQQPKGDQSLTQLGSKQPTTSWEQFPNKLAGSQSAIGDVGKLPADTVGPSNRKHADNEVVAIYASPVTSQPAQNTLTAPFSSLSLDATGRKTPPSSSVAMPQNARFHGMTDASTTLLHSDTGRPQGDAVGDSEIYSNVYITPPSSSFDLYAQPARRSDLKAAGLFGPLANKETAGNISRPASPAVNPPVVSSFAARSTGTDQVTTSVGVQLGAQGLPSFVSSPSRPPHPKSMTAKESASLGVTLEPSARETPLAPTRPKPPASRMAGQPLPAVLPSDEKSAKEAEMRRKVEELRRKRLEKKNNSTDTPGLSAVKNRTHYRILYSFTATRPDELTLDVGDVVEVDPSDTTAPTGWLNGTFRGASGLFPANYSEVVTDTDMVASPMLRSKSADQLSIQQHVHIKVDTVYMDTESRPFTGSESNLPSQAESEVSISEPASYIGECEALHEYSGPPGDLSFEQGDLIMVKENEKDWWTGYANGLVGTFPFNYVQMLLRVESRKSMEICQVVTPYSSQHSPELSLSTGQLVQVFHKNKTGWWLGAVQARGKKRQSGWFPAENVKVLGPAENNQRASYIDLGPPKASEVKTVAAPRTQDQVLALYSYNAQNPDELSFFKGSVISVLEKEGDWWRGEVGGSSGLFPSNYVQLLNTLPETAAAQSMKSFGHGSFGDLSEQERNRQFCIHEIITSEQNYVNDLSIALEIFYNPIAESGYLTPAELQVVFVNWKELIMCNTKLLKAFLVRKRMSPHEQISIIGDIFIEQIPHFKPYIRFCSCQLKACKLLQKKIDIDTEFKQLEKKCAMDPKAKQNLPLSSYLLKPLQRVTKYPLLIRTVLKHTPESHPDHNNLLLAQEKCEELCLEVNEGVRLQENSDRLEYLQTHVAMEGLKEELVFNSQTNCLGQRKFLHYGVLYKVKSSKELRGFLFNDFILLCRCPNNFPRTNKFPSEPNATFTIYRKPIFLNQILVKLPTTPDPTETVFQVIHIHRIYHLRAESKTERNNWVSQLQRAADEFISTERVVRVRTQRARSVTSDYVGTILVTVIEGRHIKPSDQHRPSNPYCELAMGSQEHKTKVVPSSVNPVWNSKKTFTLKNLREDVLCITVYDQDDFSPDDFLGRTEVRVADLLETGQGPWTKHLVLHEVPTGEITVHLEIDLKND